MRLLFVLCITFCLLVSGLAGTLFFICTSTWIDVSVFEKYNPGRPSIVLDDAGNEWMRFALDRRDPIPLNQLPSHLVESFLSAEDWHFFSHYGISVRGIIRSIFVNLYHGRKIQGASTITQQVVKLLFLNLKKTFSRKIKEQLYALIIEQQFTKHQILEIYLNHIYFGRGIYGVEAAAQRFWHKSAAQVSIAQSATLAGIIRSPNNYCPLLHPLSCEYRRNIILFSMLKRGVISDCEYAKAIEEPLSIAQSDQNTYGAHMKEMIRQYMEQLVGKKELYSGGLTIQTTVNTKLQEVAEEAFQKHIVLLKQELSSGVDGGLISFEVQTGEIKALVGGADFTRSSFNRVMQGYRQFGSIFKPLVYAAAMEQGRHFSDVLIDEPMYINQNNTRWSPNNWDHQFRGAITRAFALSHSNNIVTIKTLLDIGVDKVIALAQRCHVSGPYFPYPSLALGCIDGSLKQAATLFNIFANDGIYVEPYYIRWVKDKWGAKVYKAQVVSERVLSRVVTGKVAKVLMHGFKKIRKWFNQWFSGEAIGKTGTTNDSRTCWYIGSTPHITTAVYIGHDDNRSLGRNVYPMRTSFPIWLAVTKEVSQVSDTFMFDPNLQLQIIHGKTGKPCLPNDPEAIELFV